MALPTPASPTPKPTMTPHVEFSLVTSTFTITVPPLTTQWAKPNHCSPRWYYSGAERQIITSGFSDTNDYSHDDYSASCIPNTQTEFSIGLCPSGMSVAAVYVSEVAGQDITSYHGACCDFGFSHTFESSRSQYWCATYFESPVTVISPRNYQSPTTFEVFTSTCLPATSSERTDCTQVTLASNVIGYQNPVWIWWEGTDWPILLSLDPTYASSVAAIVSKDVSTISIPEEPNRHSPSKLGTRAIAGIVVGSVLRLTLLIRCHRRFQYRTRTEKPTESSKLSKWSCAFPWNYLSLPRMRNRTPKTYELPATQVGTSRWTRLFGSELPSFRLMRFSTGSNRAPQELPTYERPVELPSPDSKRRFPELASREMPRRDTDH